MKYAIHLNITCAALRRQARKSPLAVDSTKRCIFFASLLQFITIFMGTKWPSRLFNAIKLQILREMQLSFYSRIKNKDSKF